MNIEDFITKLKEDFNTWECEEDYRKFSKIEIERIKEIINKRAALTDSEGKGK